MFRPVHAAQRRPVAEDHGAARRAPARYREPWHQARWCAFDRTLVAVIKITVGTAKTGAGQDIDDATQAFRTAQRVGPAVRIVAVHLAYKAPETRGIAHQIGRETCGEK